MKTIEQTRRELFFRWFDEQQSIAERCGLSLGQAEADLMEHAFSAALDCVVIELPPELHAYTGQPQEDRLLDADRNHTIKQCRAAIESTNLGIKVK